MSDQLPPTIQLPAEVPAVENRVRATYQPPPIPESVLNRTHPETLNPAEINKLAENDAWHKQIKKRWTEFKDRPNPTEQEIKSAWKEVLKAYWVWVCLRYAKKERKQSMEALELKMRLRKIELVKDASQLKINRLRMKMGRKFREGLSSAGVLPSATLLRPKPHKPSS